MYAKQRNPSIEMVEDEVGSGGISPCRETKERVGEEDAEG
jgi:hypothetical protein